MFKALELSGSRHKDMKLYGIDGKVKFHTIPTSSRRTMCRMRCVWKEVHKRESDDTNINSLFWLYLRNYKSRRSIHKTNN